MSRLGRVPPFWSELNFELTSFKIDILPCLNETRVGFVQVEIDLRGSDGACGVPCEFDRFGCVDGSSRGGRSVEISSTEITG